MSIKVLIALDADEARPVWNAISGIVTLMDSLDDIPPTAPLYGKRDLLVAVARRLDHECNQAGIPR